MKKTRQNCKGFTLVEMLVALLVLSIGLLGVAALQTKGQQFNHRAYLRTQATFLAHDLMERMRNNRDNALSGSYVIDARPEAAEVNCDSEECGVAQLAAFDLEQWFALVEGGLPEGAALVTWDNSMNGYAITIRWAVEKDADAGLAEQTWWIVL